MKDPELRALLRPTLPSGVVIDEVGILRGSVLADVVHVNDLLHGYEIKGASDSRVRLPRQVAAYSRVFDRCTLVTEPCHLGAIATLPPWWGVLVAEDGALREHRAAGAGQPEPHAVARLLWTADILPLLEARQAARGVRGKPHRILCDRLCEAYTVDEIRARVRRALIERRASSAVELPAGRPAA